MNNDSKSGSSSVATKIGTPTSRVDGRLKVTGSACYAADHPTLHPAYAWLKTSAIAKGRIVAIDERAARAVPGVLGVFTYRNIGTIEPGKTFSEKGFMGSSIAPLQQQILYDGQIVALVAADSPEAAREGAMLLDIRYAEDPPSSGFDSAGVSTGPAHPPPPGAPPPPPEPKVGNFDRAYPDAAVKVDERYATPTQHHNPIELFSTTCAWGGGNRLTVWEGSQNVSGYKHGLALQLGMAPENIRIVSPFVGGAFGSRGSLTQRTAIVALAARALGRPLKLEPTRAQGFTLATYRAETRHHVRLGARADGRLVAMSHEGEEITSRPDDYKVSGVETTTRLYACPHIAAKVTMLHADRNTPGFMRSPPETPYLFALECAMDELAVALKMDPIELRRVNDTQREPIHGLPYTSRQLMPCFDAAAEAFGWSRRSAAPRSMRDDDWLIGWGCASTVYPSTIAPATARVRLTPQGHATVHTGTHEIGNGACTAVAITASDKLGIPIEQVEVVVGDSELPPAPVAGGSNSTASVCNAVALACEKIVAQQRQARKKGQTVGALEAYAEHVPHGAKPEQVALLYKGVSSIGGGFRTPDRVQAAFGASFAEVRVHSRTHEIRVPRIVGAYAFGQVVNPKAAESQLMGGQIWGVSCALHEATEIDPRAARYVNADLAEYLVPVNADIPSHRVIILPERDRKVNSLGIKGVGELGNVGMNAAVANAVFHATGVRVRKLPIRLEDLLSSAAG